MTELSPREKEVLGLIASGFTLLQIAYRLGLSYNTVDMYRRRSIRKLGAVSSAHAVAIALVGGIVLDVDPSFHTKKRVL